jgi:hypothetical protein
MKRKLRVLKARGGKDASKDDFKTPAQAFTPSPGDTGGEGGNVTNTNTNTNNQKGPGRVTKHPPNIPVIGPLTAGYNIIKNLVAGKKTHPFSANTIKQTKTKPPMGGGGSDRGPQLCPDGTMPPCKTTSIVKPNQPNKSNFLANFQAYNSGGISYGPPPLRGPNPQVPPVKMRNGKMTKSYKMSCPHRPDGIRGVGAAIKGHKFIGVK